MSIEPSPLMWMVRAGQEGRWIDLFSSEGVVGLGWGEVGDLSQCQSKPDLLLAVSAAYPNKRDSSSAAAASQLWRFQSELKVGDAVVTYDRSSRLYLLGEINSPVAYADPKTDGMTVQRAINWRATVSRDSLTPDSRNRLGAILSLFKVPATTADELNRLAAGETMMPSIPEPADEIIDTFDGVADEAILRIADKVSALSWYDMQRLVAALLRAMGYRTEISPYGPDRGKDIFASPDGFGFEQPRIAVEVKHRPGQKIDAPTLRSFLGGRHKDDRGLFVSTGGFSKDAYYEADRAPIPLKLMTLDELARAVVDNYDKFDSEGRTLLPLVRLYWPA